MTRTGDCVALLEKLLFINRVVSPDHPDMEPFSADEFGAAVDELRMQGLPVFDAAGGAVVLSHIRARGAGILPHPQRCRPAEEVV